MKPRLLILVFGLMLLPTLSNAVFAQESPRPPQKNEFQFRERLLAPLAERVELTPEMEKAALDYLAQNDPRAAEELQKIKLINPQIYHDRVRRILQEKQHLEMLQKNNPARYEREIKIRDLERQSRELSENYRKTENDASRPTIRTNLATAVTQLFDLREMNRQDDVKRLETELKRLKETLDLRQKNRGNIIERRVQELTGEAGATEWE